MAYAWDPLALNAFVLFDTEYTAWSGSHERDWSGPGEHRELIQLSAIRVRRWNTSSTAATTSLPGTLRSRQLAGHVSLGTRATVSQPLPRRDGELLVVAELKLTIKPVINPVLSEYITDLTGITDEDIAREGVSLAEAMKAFKAFCGGGWANFMQVGSFGSDEEVLHENFDLQAEMFDASAYRGWTGSFHDVVPYFVENQGVDLAVGGTVIKFPSPLNVLKYTCNYSCY
jgi:hypothetical protein